MAGRCERRICWTGATRGGGNITGVSMFSTVLVAKRLELLRELVPNVAVVAFLVNPTN